MGLYIFIGTLCAYAFACVTAFLSLAHMFQLNSYKASEQLGWMRKNIGAVSSSLYAAAFCAVSVFSGIMASPRSSAVKIVNIVYFAAFILFALSELPKKRAKKPLVLTARVRRLMLTYMIIALIFAGGSAYVYFSGSRISYCTVLFIGYFLLPLIILLANVINAPAEASVRRHYINDAKKILASCPRLTVVGITGSYGKTSMKFYLTTLLRQRFNVLMTPESYNTPMGVVKTIRGELRGYHEIFVCEMGAKKLGEIDELCGIVSPRHGIITSIGPQHLESFKSIENVVSTKFELADDIKDGKVFVNLDNEYIRDNLRDNCISYGTSPDADYSATVLSVTREGTRFSVKYPDGTVCEYKTALIGAHNVVNLCGACAMASFLGVSEAEIAEGMKKITAVPHRLQLIPRGRDIIIDDAFNSNPSGCRAALDTLGRFDEMKILVTPGMIELGEAEESENKLFGKEAAEVCDFVILVGEKQTRPILAGLHEAGYPDDKIYVAASLDDALKKAYSVGGDGCARAILLENDLPDNY